jgi:hypothetical protein
MIEDPIFIIGHNIFGFDEDYVYTRCKMLSQWLQIPLLDKIIEANNILDQ